MASEVVHDDDVAGLEGRHELLLDIGEEADAVDRPVEDKGRGELVTAQRREEGHGLPVAMGRVAVQTPALRPPAPDRRHVGLDPGLVDEHQAFGIKPGLPGPPSLPVPGDRRPGLFKSEQGFF